MATSTILSEYGISVPDDTSVAMVIYCSTYGCGCLYIFFDALGESELRQEEVWRARADQRYLPAAGESSARLLQYCGERWPQALQLRQSLCLSMDAADVFEANACGFCSSLSGHPDECPSLLEDSYDPAAAETTHTWYYGYRMGWEGRWNGFIARVPGPL